MNTKWTLTKIIDIETNEAVEFPEQLDKFDILFKQLGIIELPGLCNYSYGTLNKASSARSANDEALVVLNRF